MCGFVWDVAGKPNLIFMGKKDAFNPIDFIFQQSNERFSH